MIDGGVAQQLVYEALIAAEICDGRVFDSNTAPGTTTFPHVEIGEVQVLSDDLSGGIGGVEEFLTLHIWSRHRGKAEVRSIAQAITAALHAQAIDVTSPTAYDSLTVFVRDLNAFRDPDGLTEHGVLTLQMHYFAREA